MAIISLSKMCLVWVRPEADSKTRIQIQVVYLGGKGNTGGEVGKRDREIIQPKQGALSSKLLQGIAGPESPPKPMWCMCLVTLLRSERASDTFPSGDLIPLASNSLLLFSPDDQSLSHT